MANLTARNLATLVHTPTKKKAPTGNRRGRPRATEVIAKTNHKVDDFFRKKQTQVDRPMQEPEEEKKQEAPREEAVEFIDTSSNPQPSSVQQPAEVRTTGTLRVQVIEESKTGAFLSAKVDNPEAKRIKMVEQMRKSKRKEILSKKRENMALNQTLQEGAGLAECEFYIPGEEDEYGHEDPS